MADEAAEAAFLNAMQSSNDAVGMFQGVSGAASQQEADPASDDEYEPALAVQADPMITDAQDVSLFSSSFAVKHNALPSTSTPQHGALPFATSSTQEHPDLDAQDQSRSMSPDSTQSAKDDSTAMHRAEEEVMPDPVAADANDEHGAAGDITLANGDSLAQASHTAPSIVSDSISTSNLPLHNDVQDRPSPDIVQHGVAASNSAVPVPLPNSANTAQGKITNGPQTVQSTSQAEVPASTQSAISPTTALPKARLPHDRIGILEDRIKEDPRGDTEAWLALIAEHQKRGKTEDARNAYERLFTVFPWAVS